MVSLGIQALLHISAVTLLFERVSSDWFKGVNIYNEEPENRNKTRVGKAAVVFTGFLFLGVAMWQMAQVARTKSFVDAVDQNRLKEVRELLDKGVNLMAKKSHFDSPVLLRAAGSGHLEVVSLLLDRGADVNNTRGRRGDTALIVASRMGHLDVVRLLLSRGADTNATNNIGQTALMLASENGRTEIVELLKAHGATE